MKRRREDNTSDCKSKSQKLNGAFNLVQVKDVVFHSWTIIGHPVLQVIVRMNVDGNIFNLDGKSQPEHGAYGVVFFYTCQTETQLAVKYFFDPSESELEKKISDLINHQPQPCPVVRSLPYEILKNQYCLIMERYQVLTEPVPEQTAVQIVGAVMEQMKCLAQLYLQPGYPCFYTDLKPDNVLVQKLAVGYRVALADLGSVAPDDNGYYLTSYSLPVLLTGTVSNQHIALSKVPHCLPYLLAILEFSLQGIQYQPLWWKHHELKSKIHQRAQYYEKKIDCLS